MEVCDHAASQALELTGTKGPRPDLWPILEGSLWPVAHKDLPKSPNSPSEQAETPPPNLIHVKHITHLHGLEEPFSKILRGAPDTLH